MDYKLVFIDVVFIDNKDKMAKTWIIIEITNKMSFIW
jgi:hypothetical protein